MEPEPIDHTRRDADTFVVLGLFVTLLALPVLLGTFWAVRPHAMVVNVVAGVVLLLVGVALLLRGFALRKRVR